MAPGDIVQSVLAPAGRQAWTIHQLWSLMLVVSTVIFAVVLIFLLVALRRGLRQRHNNSTTTSERTLTRVVASAVGLTVVILGVLLVASFWTGRTIASLQASSAVSISIVGHQWWWEVEYEDAVPNRRVLTANEIHIPLNRPVVLKVTSHDVIHSFWAPNLHGKRDLIPGYTTAIWLQADRAGVFRGQCAEFCGRQHAHMAFTIVAEPESDFEHWLDGMRQPARPPQSAAEQRGYEVFMTARCAGCHAMTGTQAQGRVAPDLTHVAARSTLGAGTLPNTAEHRAAWIRDPQTSKPGNQMPPNPLSAEDIEALSAYLGALR